MKDLNKRVAELVKGNKTIENYLEVSALEKTNEEKLNKLMAQIKTSNDRLIDSWVKSGKFALAVEKVLNNMMKDLKAEDLSITMKQLVPLAVGSYQAFRRNVQIGNLSEKQVEAFRTAVHKDSTIAVQKTSILDFAKGVKKTKTTTSKPKSKPTNAGGGKEETKDSGQESNIIFGCHFTPFGLVKAKGSLKITKGGIENADKLTPEQLLDMRNALKFAEAQLEKLASKKTIKRAKK